MGHEDKPSAEKPTATTQYPVDEGQGPFRGVELPGGRFIFDFGNFRVFVAAEIRDGTLRITAIDTRADDVTSAVHRAVPIRELRAEIERQLVAHDFASVLAGNLRATGRDVPKDLVWAERRTADAVASLDPGHPARVASHYLDAYQRDPRKPVAVMAAELERSRNTVAGWVRRARDEGWLTRESGEPGRNNQQGRAGGMPGPRFIEWLRQEEER